MHIVFCAFMFVFGAAIGSFLCCQARRLRRRETGRHSLGSRSVCLHCHHRLAWYENLPLLSWLIQKGKCRHCGRFIGLAEFLAELGAAGAFLALAFAFLSAPAAISGLFGAVPATAVFPTFPVVSWLSFGVTVILATLILFLAIYDGLYGELPSLLLTFAIICAIILVILRDWSFFSVATFSWQPFLSLLGSITILGGTYLLLYLVSRGKWVGSGDWLLGLALGLALGSPWLALVALFVANLSATLIMLPVVKSRRSSQIYFGPFLVLAFFIVYALAEYVIIKV